MFPVFVVPLSGPQCWLPAENDFSIIIPIATVPDTDGDLVYLVTAHPFDRTIVGSVIAVPRPVVDIPPTYSGYSPVPGSEVAVRFGTRNYWTKSTDTPSNTQFPGVIQDGYSIQLAIGSQSDPIGPATVGIGDITLMNSGGDYDSILDFSWGGREVEIEAVLPGASYSTAVKVLQARIPQMRFDEQTINFPLLSKLDSLDVPIQLRVYTGQGGSEGTESLTGLVIPEVWGRRLQVPMSLLNAAFQIWRVCLEASSISNVRNRALSVTFSGFDYPSYNALLSASVSPGYYSTCIAEGLVRFGSEVSVPTADVDGPTAAGLTASDIIQWAVEYKMPASSQMTAAGLDNDSFSTVKSLRGFTVGVYISEQTNGLPVFQQLMKDIAGYLISTREGLLRLGLYSAPTSASSVNTITVDDVDDAGISDAGTFLPTRRILVEYAPRTYALGAQEISEAATEEERESASAEHLSLDPIDTLSHHRDSQDFVYVTSVINASEALELSGYVRGVLELRRWITVPLAGRAFKFWPGDHRTLIYPRFGFSNGRRVMISDLEERSEGGCSLVVRYNPDSVE